MVLIITDVNWLNSALKYSVIPTFSVRYMCMSAVFIFYDKTYCTFELSVETLEWKSDKNDEILVYQDEKEIIFIQTFKINGTTLFFKYFYISPFKSYLTHKHNLKKNPPPLS